MSSGAPDLSPRDVIGDARALLDGGEIDLLTCDVFDTLVWRPVSEPHHLFVRLGRRLADDGLLHASISPADFARGRREAERRARQLHRLPGAIWGECTLEEIWSRVPARWCRVDPEQVVDPGIDDWRGRCLDVEMQVEAECLGLDESVAELLTLAHRSGVTTALLSDTYFSGAQLTTLLASAGAPLDAIDHVVASSDRRKGKHAGMLRDVVTELAASPARTLHLGDNPIADVEAAESIGAIAIRAVVPHEEQAAPGVLDAIETYSATTGDDGGITAAVTMTLRTPAVRGRPDAELGTAIGGPLLRGFANWVSHTADELGVDTIHCLLREGGMIADLIAATEPDGPRPVTVHASRWTMLRAAVFDGTPDELFRALARNVDFEPQHVVEAFEVDPDHVADVLGDRPFSARRRDEAMRRIAADDRLRGAILERSAQLRTRVLRYLDGVLSPTDGRLVVCDIGWGGTIQEGLEEILRHEGRLADDGAVTGLYLSMSTPGEERVGRGASMRSYLPIDAAHAREQQVLMRTPEILEQLCTPNTGTLLDIDADGRPLTASADPTWTESRSIAQQAMREMVTNLAAVEVELAGRSSAAVATDTPPIWRHPDFRSALLRGVASTLEAPTPQLARTVSAWLHDDVAGGRVVPLADPARLDHFRYLNAADLGLVSSQEVFWLAGAAASTNPTLAAQLAAAAKGVEPSSLCPPSSAGRATVAVYEPTAQNAVAVDDPVPRTGALGWSMLRLQTDARAVRAIRVDFGDIDHLVELAHLDLTFHLRHDGQPTTSTWRIADFTDRRTRWVGGGRTLSAHLAAVRAGGYLVVDVTGSDEAESHRVEVECAFRATELDPADAHRLLPSVTRVRATELARRVGTGLDRRGRALLHRRRTPEPATPVTDGPTFSIVLPIYNSPLGHLERQLGAIRAQTYPHWECIVVDDGSSDPAPRRLAGRFADDDRFTVYARPANGGIAAATNDALDRASNDWIVFVDHDDLVHDDALATIAAHIALHPDDDVVYTDEQTVDEHGNLIVEYRKPNFSPERLLGHNYFCHIVSMRRELVERIGRLDAAFEPSADRQFNMRAAAAARSVGHVPEILYSWRAIPGSVARSIDEKSDVGRSVVAAAEQRLAQRGDDATVESVPGDAASVRITRPAATASVDRLPVDRSTSASEVDHFLRRSDADVVVLEPVDAIAGPADDADGLDQLVALCVRPESPVVGPRIVADDGRLVSAGRANHPTFGDLFQGTEADNPGPWGAFVVTREVSSISPLGAVLDRRAVIEAGGFDIASIVATLDPNAPSGVDIGDAACSLDMTMAVLCAALQRSGRPALWSPLMTIVVPAGEVLDPTSRLELAEQHLRLTEIWPFLADEPYSPTGVHRS